MSKIRFGPAGLGSVKDAVSNLESLHKKGLAACEIGFTYGAYIKNKEDGLRIGKAARRLGIFLSIHAPYYVNLNSKEAEKIEASKERILKCCEVGSWLGARRVVFHSGFYSGMKSEEAAIKVREGIFEMKKIVEEKGWDIELCPEVMGKKNVFGSIDEIADLVNTTGCGFCIDIAHVLARYGKYEFEKIKDVFKADKWHVHFSGIIYGDKGEKKHKLTEVDEWKKVLGFLKKLDKDVVIICESPEAVNDSVVGKKIWESL